MNVLEELKLEKFRNFIRSDIIKYKKINGYQYVDDEFTKEVLKRNPLDYAEKFFDSLGIQTDNIKIYGLAFLSMNINNIIKEEIAKLTHDVKFGGKYTEYMDLFKTHGFEIIYEKEYDHKSYGDEESRKEKEVFFWNENNGMLIHMDSFGLSNEPTGNSVNLFCQGKKRDTIMSDHSTISANYISGTDYMTISTDLRDLPGLKIQEIIKNFDLEKEWKEISSTEFHSYLSHNKGDNEYLDDEVWKSNMFEKINSFPEHVKKSLLSKICSAPSDEDVLEKLGYSNDYFKVKEILENIQNNDLKKSAINNILFDFRYSSNHHLAMNDDIVKLLKDSGIDNPRDFNSMVVDKVRRMDLKIEDNIDDVIAFVKTLNKKDLKTISDRMEKKVRLCIAKPEEEKIFKLVNSKLNSKPKFH